MLAALSLAGFAALMSGCTDRMIVLNPKGVVGRHQLDLIVITTILCLVVIVPVIVMAFVFAWRYRSRNGGKADYRPDWEHNSKLETVWWGIPIVIIAILAAITVRYSHLLEPSRPLESEAEPLVIQVTSLDYKWLFQYPEQGIATVNYVEFPAGVPVRFELTSDAPMNSFWIPQLGGQIYTMSGMAMKLNLMADEPGTYMGSGANFSGEDFAKMRFDARAVTEKEFDHWVEQIKATAPALTDQGYDELARPGAMGTQDYSSIPEGLFDRIVNKYAHGAGHSHGGAAQAETDTDPDLGNQHDMDDMAGMSGMEHHH
nr:ubiquinol oxidase subunit II [Cohnella sp. YIM B05605]